MQVQVKFKISDAYRKQQAVETGETPDKQLEVELVLDTPRLRQDWIDLYGLSNRGALTDLFSVTSHPVPEAQYKNADGSTSRYKLADLPRELESPPDENKIKELISEMAQGFRDGLGETKAAVEAEKIERARQVKEAQPYLEAIEAAKTHEDYHAISQSIPKGLLTAKIGKTFHDTLEYKLKNLFSQLASEEHEARAAELESDKTAWIEAHGSDRLKRAHKHGYEVGRIYAIERAKFEAPEFVIDFYDEAEWKERTNPSSRELDELDKASELGIGSSYEIAWLISLPNNDPNNRYGQEYIEPCPAIVIHGYLKKYNLIKEL